MSQLIAGLYEIEKEIGSGGGGIVYLGRHIRLRKQVVLKADKRSLSTDEASLRREVDFLKELSNTYIPQVYDYVQEDGIVYTVMDFIDGESLDKILKRKQIPSQPQVIQWACQLLEALDYLHNQKPHGILHGDIKPANIMLRTDGNACLIDFNIALALGEDGAVKVGYSRGYASPEHYGSSYISENRPAAVGRFTISGKNKNESKSVSLQQKKQSEYELRQKDDYKTELLLEQEGDDKTELLSGQEEERTELLLTEQENGQRELQVKKHFRQPSFSVGSSTGSQRISSTGSATGSGHGILLDARSDIYSLGATLYHLLSGRRPSQDAVEVEPLGKEICSPAVSVIIRKAMAPDPAMRYQTAKEMRQAFLDLYKDDERVISFKRQSILAAVLLFVLFLVGGGCTFKGLQQMEKLQRALTLAEYSEGALKEGNVRNAVKLAMEGAREETEVLNTLSPQTQEALAAALGVYDLADGFKAYDTLEIPAVPFEIVFSPEGTGFAVAYAYELAVYRTADLEEITKLPMQESALSDVVFISETQFIYAGTDGITAYDLQADKEIWKGNAATTITISADKNVIAAVNRDEEKAVIYKAATGEIVAECSFGEHHMSTAFNDIFADPKTDVFALNQDGTMLAVSFSDGSLTVFDLTKQGNDIQVLEESDASIFTGGFHDKYFAFTAKGQGNSTFGMIDTAACTYVAGYESTNKVLLQTDEQGIYLADGSLLVLIEPENMTEKELAYTDGNSIMGFSAEGENVLVATDDNGFSFYKSGKLLSKDVCKENCDFTVLSDTYAVVANQNQNILRILIKKQYEESFLLAYNLGFEHAEARISHDKQKVMFFNYEEFAICDKSGKVIFQTPLPDAETIYDQQFRRENNTSYLEVIWYDGKTRHYSAIDGSLIYEVQNEPPSKNLYEEFYTDSYKIVSNLHGVPEAYEKETGELIATLEEDAYLTYVTQVGENILTEYISTSGERYGVLLNDRLEKLAVLPGVCDLWGDMLIFDYGTGNLRHSRLFSSQELITLGEKYIQNEKGGDAK